MSKRFREAMDHGLRDIKISPDLEQKIFAQTIHRKGALVMRRKLSLSLAVALIALLILVGVAFATGMAQSIISSMKDMYDREDETKYDVLEELSSDLETTRELSQIDEYKITLSQSYYDGEQIILGYKLDGQLPAADFSFGPDSERFDELEDSFGSFQWEGNPTESHFVKFMELLRDEGSAGMIFYDVYVGDHLLLANGTQLPAYNQTKVENGYYIELLRPLPDAARNKSSLDIVFQVKRTKSYYYKDATGSYYFFDHDATVVEQVTFTIPRSTEQVKWYEGTYRDDLYTSEATVQVSPVNLWVKIQVDVPEDRNIWSLSWEEMSQLKENGIDVIRDYVLIADGIRHTSLSQQDSIDETQYTLEGEYAAAIGDCSELRLRPIYSVRGEVPEEDIVVDLEK